MNYAVRITRPYVQVASWVSRVAMVCEKMVVYEHSKNVSRVHIHAHLWGCADTDDTLKNWLSQTLNVKVNKSDISFKQIYKPKGSTQSRPIDDGNISYMSKGKYDPVYNKGYSQEEIAELKAKGFDKKEDFGKKKSCNDEGLYYAFCEYIDEVYPNPLPELYNWDKIKSYTWAFCLKEIGICLNANFMNKRNMLLRTWFYQHHDVVSPEGVDNSVIFKNYI